eukprot:7384297-Prymnesium_polylepis.1
MALVHGVGCFCHCGRDGADAARRVTVPPGCERGIAARRAWSERRRPRPSNLRRDQCVEGPRRVWHVESRDMGGVAS